MKQNTREIWDQNEHYKVVFMCRTERDDSQVHHLWHTHTHTHTHTHPECLHSMQCYSRSACSHSPCSSAYPRTQSRISIMLNLQSQIIWISKACARKYLYSKQTRDPQVKLDNIYNWALFEEEALCFWQCLLKHILQMSWLMNVSWCFLTMQTRSKISYLRVGSFDLGQYVTTLQTTRKYYRRNLATPGNNIQHPGISFVTSLTLAVSVVRC